MIQPATRRGLLVQAARLAGLALAPAAWAAAPPIARMPDDPFRLGVASGEPAPDGMVIWTRLCTRPQDVGGGMPQAPVMVEWQVADDRGMDAIVASGRTLATPEAGHSVHVEVQGLRPGREYWYRFLAAGHASPAGRTLTAPAVGADAGRLRVAFASCQKFEAGYYGAHRQIARAAPDLVLFLGDYIYEKPMSLDGVRRHPLFEARDIDGYRLRYASYRADPDLQASHAVAPWMAIWDDHEVSNDYGSDQNRGNSDPATFLKRRAAAYQAYYENMPLRRTSMPVGPRMQLYRSLAWGRLAEIQLLDTRQYRSHRGGEALSKGKRVPSNCAELGSATRTLLGRTQEAWLRDRLVASSGRWNVLAQQYVINPLRQPDGTVSNDCWDGFTAGRRRLLETWRDAKVSNPLALGGDIHSFLAGDLALTPGGKPIASEFVGGSISSIARPDALPPAGSNPNIHFGHTAHRGFGLLEIERKQATVSFRAVENALVPNSPAINLVKFAVENGRPGLHFA